MEEESTSSLVTKYFSYGFKQKEIQLFLRSLHGMIISSRTLKRILSKLKLYRRKHFSSIRQVVTFIENELKTSGQLHGYRWMHLRCIQNNLVVTQEVVAEILRFLDPEGYNIRKKKRLRRRQYFNKGPNYLWHVDSYDKLKPYGICINGCIDGFSRHIIWLRLGPTSNDPKVIAGYFMDAIRITGGCPTTVRSDMGTENGMIERLQKAFHQSFNVEGSNRPSFIYGKSTHNQRIESWWCTLRKHCIQFWMNIFQSLKEDNYFQGTLLDKMLIQFCFSSIIQKELQQIVQEWNIHKISKTRNSISPTGRPALMYEIPSFYGAQSYLIPVPSFVIDELSSNCTFIKYPCNVDFYELCNIIVEENHYFQNDTPDSCIELYKNLRRCLHRIFGITG